MDVLLPLYGPGLADQLRGSNFAVLLRHQQQPVTAGLLDVYGQVSGWRVVENACLGAVGEGEKAAVGRLN